MCQEGALSTLQMAVAGVLEHKICVVHCQSGFHRAETISGVAMSVIGWHARVHCLHLPCSRSYVSDVHHDVGTALSYAQDPWPLCPKQSSGYHKHAMDRFQQACYTRPESCANWELFEESSLQLGDFFGDHLESIASVA